MEWVQLEFTKDRDYENGDIVADAIGAIVGMIISMLWVKHEKRRLQ
jgi:VanZ family protein